MKRMQKTRWLLILMTVIMLSGCGKQKTGSDAVFDTSCMFAFSDDGIVVIDHSGCICYADDETGTMIPLCTRLNCMHDLAATREEQEKCNALYLDGEIVAAFMINSKLYVLTNEGQNHSVMYRSDYDGSNRKKIAEADFFADSCRIYMHHQILYFSARVYSYDISGMPSEEMDYFIAGFDLNNNRFEEITARHHDYGQINILGIDDKKITYLLQERSEAMVIDENDFDKAFEGEKILQHSFSDGSDKVVFEKPFSVATYFNDSIYYQTHQGDEYTLYVYDCKQENDTMLHSGESDAVYYVNGKILLWSEMTDWQRQMRPACEFKDKLLIWDVWDPEDVVMGIIHPSDYLNNVPDITYLKRSE